MPSLVYNMCWKCVNKCSFFDDKNLSEPVDLNQFFFFCRVCPKYKRIASLIALSFSFPCIAFTAIIAKRLEEATFSDSGHTADPNIHFFHLHQPHSSQQRFHCFCSRNKKIINYAFFKRIIECPWIENWAENQFLCLMQKRKNAFATYTAFGCIPCTKIAFIFREICCCCRLDLIDSKAKRKIWLAHQPLQLR